MLDEQDQNAEEQVSLEDLAGRGSEGAPAETVRDSLRNAMESATNGDKAAQQAPQPDTLSPPEHWAEEDRNIFAKQPRDAQEWLLKRHSAMEADNTKVSQELAELKKWREPLEQVIAPYADVLKQNNLSPAQVLQNYISAEQALMHDPVNSILQLAQRYRVNPQDLMAAISGQVDAAPQQEVDPTVKALQDRIAQLEGYLGNKERDAQQTQAHEVNTQLEEFKNAAGEGGKKLYPHMENQQVRDLMSVLIGSGRVDIAKAGGVGPALKQAYEQAVFATPETREALLKAEKDAALKQAAESQAEKVRKARSAGASVSGSSALATSPAANGSVRQLLEREFREAGLIN